MKLLGLVFLNELCFHKGHPLAFSLGSQDAG